MKAFFPHFKSFKAEIMRLDINEGKNSDNFSNNFLKKYEKT